MQIASISGKVDPLAFVPEKNFGAGGEARILVETDRHYSDQTVIWQQEVYAFARDVLDRTGAGRVVDFGAGAGHKFIDAFKGCSVERFQVDWDDRREAVVEVGSPEESVFLLADFEDPSDLERLAIRLADGPPTVFLLSDVIEHLSDSRPLLAVLRRLLRGDSRNRLIISTPDRERVDGLASTRAPDNLGHVRQWTLNEFGLALCSAGFEIHQIGHVPQNNFDRLSRTIACEVSCSEESYAGFLTKFGLPAASDHVVITSEHSNCVKTGGIGTYHRLVREVAGLQPIYLFAGSFGIPDEWRQFIRSQGWLHVAEFCDGTAPADTLNPDDILKAVRHILFIYDRVRLIEYQDYHGIGARVAQAKRAGLIAPTVTVIADAHGSHFYLENAAGDLDSGRGLQVYAYERISLEQADAVVFASKFVEDLYVERQGLKLRQRVRQGYPVRFERQPGSDLLRGPIDTLLFYGKQTPQKGYPDFCNAIVDLFSNPEHVDAARHIKRIVLMGVASPDPRLLELPGVSVENGSYDRQTALGILRANAVHALAVLPYKGDNHPLSVYEVVDADCQLLAYKAGGLPEVVPAELHNDVLCSPDAASLAAAIAAAVRLPFWDRCQILDKTFELFKKRCEQQTEDFKKTIGDLKAQGMVGERLSRGEVSVIVPNLNGDDHFLDDLAIGIRNSFVDPLMSILSMMGPVKKEKIALILAPVRSEISLFQ